jgi:hypothetical protein
MSAEPHTLKSDKIDPETASKATRKLIVEMGHELYRGECSCRHWLVPLGTQADIRRMHAEHAQERLGPEGTERRER